ncbi:MAG: protein kinase [Myxococcaceae bacterium]|nr:protein kinase [Myxococcaceae bacterium]
MKKFNFETKLAEGSAAEAFVVRDPSSGRRAVVERMHSELAKDPEIYGRFLDQAHGLQLLHHPNLLPRRDVHCDKEGRLYTLSESIEGQPLSVWMQENGPLGAQAAVAVLIPLCEALHYLHQNGQRHGNLAPQYVFIDANRWEQPRLLDTGLTLFRSIRSIPTHTELVRPAYLAPERICGRRGDALSDIYGLGILMHEMLTGFPPYRGASSMETRRLHLKAQLKSLPRDVAFLEPIVRKCLARDRAYRYQSAPEVVLALREAAAEQGRALRTAAGGQKKPAPGRITQPLPPDVLAQPLSQPTLPLTRRSVPPSGPLLYAPTPPPATPVPVLAKVPHAPPAAPLKNTPTPVPAIPPLIAAPTPPPIEPLPVLSPPGATRNWRIPLGPTSAVPEASAELLDSSEMPAELKNAPEAIQGVELQDRMGDYEILDLLGQGGMGHVYLGKHIAQGHDVAIKVLKPDLATNPRHLRRFVDEARAVARINHPHIVQMFDLVKTEDGRMGCVMEPLRGKTLGDTLREGTVTISRALHITSQVCSALAAAHELGVVHRDMKPDNIFLTGKKGEDFVKVLDFGVAKLNPEGWGEASTLEATQTGVLVGTPSYMAPEQAAGNRVDARTDIYSLGTVLYRMVAGRVPFSAPTVSLLLAQLLMKPPKPLPAESASGEVISTDLRRLLARCLDKDPSHRFESMAELQAAIDGMRGVGPRVNLSRRRQSWLHKTQTALTTLVRKLKG